MSILQKAEYFGEEELLIPQKRRNSIICSSSSGALYLLNKDEFTKRIFNDDKTLEVLKLHLSLKKQFFQMQIRKFVTTSLKMQVSMENSKGISMDCKDRNNENFLLKESNLHIELNSDRKIRTRRLNFSKSMIHPEDIVKTLQNSEKMKTLGFESNMSSPKQKFHMLKTFFQSQDKERTINIEKPIPQKPETIPKTPQIRNAHIPKNIELRRKRSEPLNSFITMPINIENVTEFLKNKDFPACKSQNQSMVLKNEWIRSNTAGNIDCRRKTFQNIKEGLEKQEACTVKKEEFDLPLKYRSEDLKSNAKKNLKNYLRYYNPTNTQFLKTVSCFNNLQGLGSFNL